jgi:hypothetical protein
MTTSGLSSPPTPFDVSPSSTPSSCKRKLPLFDISSQSSSSNERVLSPEVLKKLTADLEDFINASRDFQHSKAYAPLPASAPSNSRQVVALRRFLESFNRSKERGDEWLSVEDVFDMIDIFLEDATAAEVYIAFGDMSDIFSEDEMRSWVRLRCRVAICNLIARLLS